MYNTFRSRFAPCGGRCLLAAILSLLSGIAAAQEALPSPKRTLFGGPEDEIFRAIVIVEGVAYVGGLGGLDDPSLAAAFALDDAAPAGLSLLWSSKWPLFASPPSGSKRGEAFYGVAASSKVWLGGKSYTQTVDPVGDKEPKTALVQLGPQGPMGPAHGGADWVATPTFFPECASYEGLSGIALSASEPEILYGTGAAYTCSAAQQYVVLAAFSTVDGASVWSTSFGETEHSDGRAIVATPTGACVAGYSGAPAVLWSVDPAGKVLWRREAAAHGYFNAVTLAADGSIVAAGVRTGDAPGGEDFLIARYTEAGQLLFSHSFGGAKLDAFHAVLEFRGRLFAAGTTNSSGAGSDDMVVYELNPLTGVALGPPFVYGGAGAWGMAADSRHIFVVGESSADGNGKQGLALNFELVAAGGAQRPGDCNQDAKLDISDAVCLLGHLFLGHPNRLPCGEMTESTGNLALLDASGDGSLDISDAVVVLTYLFSDGAAPFLSSPDCRPVEGCATGCPK